MEKNKIAEKSRLGRGLAALIPPTAPAPLPDVSSRPAAGARPAGERPSPPDASGAGIQELPLSRIVPNTLQPRTIFDQSALDELAASIAVHGILQPVVVRPRGSGRYELVAGERRFRAAEQAGLAQIPAVVRELSDEESLAVALIENIQRENLNAIEAAHGYRQLLHQFKLTQSDLARQLGKAQPTISNALRLLQLPSEMQESIALGQMTEEHGKVLLSVDDAGRRAALWRQTIDRGLSVSEARRLALGSGGAAGDGGARRRGAAAKDVHWQALEDRLRALFGMRVAIRPGLQGRGTIVLEFGSPEDVEGLLERLSTTG